MQFYAKIVRMEKGSFNYCATIWKSDEHIDSVWKFKKFFFCNSARKWSEKQIVKSVIRHSSNVFIKEQDVIRRNWDD